MREAAEAVVRDSLGVQAGERVLVVADMGTRAIGEALRDAAARAGAEAVLAPRDPLTDSVVVEPTLRIGSTPVIEAGRFLL